MTQRISSKHDLFLRCIEAMESQLESIPGAFDALQSQCVGQGIVPRPSGAVSFKDGDSVSCGPSVREFLEIVAEKIQEEEAFYDKFARALSVALDQDSLQVVLQGVHGGASHHIVADKYSDVDVDTDGSDVFNSSEDEGRESDVDVDVPATVDLLDGAVAPIDAVTQLVGAMAIGERTVFRRRNNAQSYDSHASMLRDLSRTARHERQTRRVLESDVAKKTSQNDALKIGVEQLCIEKEYAFHELERLSGEQEAEREKHRRRVTKLQKNIAAREVEVYNLRKDCQEFEACNNSLSEKITSLTNRASQTNSLKLNVASLEREVHDLEEREAEAQGTLKAKDSELKQLTAERDQLIESFFQNETIAKGNIAQCEDEIEYLVEKCFRLSKEIERHQMIDELIEAVIKEDHNVFVYSVIVLATVAICLIIFVSLYAHHFS